MMGKYTVQEIVESLDNKRLKKLFSTAQRAAFGDYHKVLERESKCLSSAEGQLYDVFSDAMSMMFVREGSTYCAHIRLSNGRRSASIEDFIGERAEVLQGVFDKIDNPLLRFRIADVLWVNRKITKFKNPIRFAVAALDACVELEVCQETWYAGRNEELWFRAIALAKSIGTRDAKYLKSFSEKLLTAFEKTTCGKQSILLSLARLMLESELPLNKPRAIPQKLESQLGHLDADDIFKRNDYYDLIWKWYERLGLKEKCIDCLFRKAEDNRVVGDKWTKEGSDPGMISGRYEEAQRCYDQLPKRYKVENDIGELSKNVRRSLHVAYQGMVKNMQHFKGKPIDISKYIAASRKSIHGLDFSSALCRFVGMHRVNVSRLKKNTKTSLRKNPTLAFFASETFENDRVAARSEGIDPYQKDIETTPRFYQWMLHIFGSQLSMEWQACLWPAYRVLREEHEVEDGDYYSIVAQSDFVPENRRFMFARGLKAGFEGDFQTAASLLLPQIENAVRIHLKKHGCDTFRRDVSKEVDSEVGLSKLVERDEMSLLFDEELRFEMRVLYGSPPNYNLRNQYAHGLVDDCSGCAMTDFLVWYNALRLVVLGCLKHPEKMGLKFGECQGRT